MILISYIVTKFQRYKLIAIAFNSLSLLSKIFLKFKIIKFIIDLILLYIAIRLKDGRFMLITVSINGFFSYMVYSVAYEIAVEVSHPVGEASSGGLINTTANVLGFIFVIATTPLLSNLPS
jgi:hypothetical protein